MKAKGLFVLLLTAAAVVMATAATAWACLAVPAPNGDPTDAFNSTTVGVQYKGENGPMAPLMGAPDGTLDGGVIKGTTNGGAPLTSNCPNGMTHCVPAFSRP